MDIDQKVQHTADDRRDQAPEALDQAPVAHRPPGLDAAWLQVGQQSLDAPVVALQAREKPAADEIAPVGDEPHVEAEIEGEPFAARHVGRFRGDEDFRHVGDETEDELAAPTGSRPFAHLQRRRERVAAGFVMRVAPKRDLNGAGQGLEPRPIGEALCSRGLGDGEAIRRSLWDRVR